MFLCTYVLLMIDSLFNVFKWMKKIQNYRAGIVLGKTGMTLRRLILLEQHQNQHNSLKILPDCIITTGINLLKPSVTQTVEQLSIELRVTPCLLSWSQNTAGSNFCFEKFPQKKFNYWLKWDSEFQYAIHNSSPFLFILVTLTPKSNGISFTLTPWIPNEWTKG